MAESLLDLLSAVMLVGGATFGVLGGLGLLRFPDFYTRLHAAGMTDTLCTLLVIGGVLLQTGWTLTSLKLLAILLFMLFTSPVASHALARAGLVSGLKPWLRTDPARADAAQEVTPSKR
ncbi:MAG: monovalent cation/H(+) antiporter subunit G [Wenzhouxiangellaceae bacterium]